MAIISSKYQSGRVVDQLGNGAYIYADNDPNGEYFGFGFTAGFNVTYDGILYKEWGNLYFDSNSNGIYEGIHVYDETSGIIPSRIGIGGEGIDEHIGRWYSVDYTSDRDNIEVATWSRSVGNWTGEWEGVDGYGRFEIISEIIFDTSNEDDWLVGSTNDDTILGLDGNDVFVGRPGDDRLYGDDGNDTLYGDSGNDILDGGLKDDVLTGGSGADTFILSGGTDQINDFNINDGDKISFADNLSYSISQSANDLLLTVNSVGKFLLKGVSTTEFDPNQHILFNDKTPPNAPTSLTTTSSITSDTTPTITGIAEAGSSVKLYNGSTLLGSATAGSNGAFSITSSTLSDASYSLTATATDAAGNISSSSSPLSIIIDTTVPSAPTSLTTTVPITNNATPTITGTAEAGSSVKLYNGSTLLGSATAGSNGVFSITSSTLSDASYSLTATATDAAGNISSSSSPLSIIIDTTVQPPLNPSKIKNGSWSEYWLTNGETGKGSFYYSAPSVDINGASQTYIDNHGIWEDSNGGYSGWWWANNTDLIYKGTAYDGQAICVIDADENSIYNSEVDYVVGYAFGQDNGGNSGTWDRTLDYEGTFTGGSFGIFALTVELDYSGINDNETILGSTKSDLLRGENGNDYLYGYEFNDKLYGDNGNDTIKGGKGDDTLDGGSGIDTSIFTGNFADYSFSLDSANGAIQIADSNSQRDGTDTVTQVESFIFNGTTYGADNVLIETGFNLYGYLASNLDLLTSFKDNTNSAAQHYINHGYAEGRNTTDFNPTNYLNNYADLTAAFGSNTEAATRHYISNGYAEGRTDSLTGSGSGGSSDLTDLEAYNYIASNNDLISAFGIDIAAAKSHYTNYGKSEGRSLTRFSASGYLEKYGDLKAAFGDNETSALRHYIQFGFNEGRTDSSKGSGSGGSESSSDLTDLEAYNYVASNNDLISALGTDIAAAKSHYTNYGKAEGRPLDNFDEWGYLASNKDLLNAFGKDATKAIKHYISYGKSEGRLTNLFNAESYLNSNSDLRNAFGNDKELAIKHYVEFGFNEGRTF